jgi:uncharacterized phage protein gp47/JayE
VAKTAAEITGDAIAALLSATSQVSNLNPGSLVRSLLDAVGAEGARLDAEGVSLASAAQLNAGYGIWGVTPAPAVASVYLLTFSNASSAAQTLSAGTLAQVPSSTLQWATDSALTVPAASGGTPGSAQVTATCQTAGSGTNVPAGTITQLVSPVAGVTVTNASGQAITPGADAETQTQTQARLSNKQNSLHRGDSAAVEVGALTAYVTDAAGNITERVTAALGLDYTPTPGKGVVYIWGSSGSPSSALLSQTQQVVNGYTDAAGAHIGYKAMGVPTAVYAALGDAVNVAAAVLPVPGYTLAMVTGPVTTTIQGFFAALDIGQGLSVSALLRAILRTPGVQDATVSAPAASLPATPSVGNPSTAPTLTATSPSPATALAAGTYDVAYTWTNIWGETEASATASVALTAGQAIQVAALALPFGAAGVNYYLSTAAGSSTLGLDASGSGAETTLTALPASGAASPPSANTATIPGNLYVPGTITLAQLVP